MNFAWAMDMVLNQERAVRREGWGDQWLCRDDEGIGMYTRTSHYSGVWYPEQHDMLAEDWVEVLEV